MLVNVKISREMHKFKKPFVGQAVKVRRLNDRMSHKAKIVISVVVTDDQDDVGRVRLFRKTRESTANGNRNQANDHPFQFNVKGVDFRLR